MKSLAVLAVLVVTLALSACGPIYRTSYTYLPPADPAALNCANNCQFSNLTCLNNCRRFQFQCQQLNTGFYGGYGPFDGPYAGYSSVYGRSLADCDISGCEESCNATYRTCFTNCGGAIQTTTVCTANCEGAPPPPVVAPSAGSVPVN